MRVAAILTALTLAPSANALCPGVDVDVGGTLGLNVVAGDTTGALDDWAATCGGGGGAEDVAVGFTAPFDGLYTFHTIGSAYDTVLSVLDGADCVTELDCSDDRDGGTDSLVQRQLLAGAEVVLVIDGYTDALGVGATGPYALTIRQAPLPTCALDADLGSALGPAVATGTTCGQLDDVRGSGCGAQQTAEDVVYQWTAPYDGTFIFSQVGSRYDAAISVMDPTGCVEQVCTDDDNSELQGFIPLTMTAGQQVRVSVDGRSDTPCGDYLLSILDDAQCPDDDRDGTCDPTDLCWGFDGNGDADLDRICDELDRCLGDDAAGDADTDGLCDDLDFSVALSAPVPGTPMALTAVRAPEGKLVQFLASAGLDLANPTCHPRVDICTVLRRPVVIGSAVADAAGTATITVDVPTTLLPLTNVYVQAAWIDGIDGAVTDLKYRATPP